MFSSVFQYGKEPEYEHKDSYNNKNKGNLMSDELVLRLNVPLMLRLLEYAREDANSDLDLHFLVENLVKLNNDNSYLAMKNYPDIVVEAS